MKFLFCSEGDKIKDEKVLDYTERISRYFPCEWKNTISYDEKDFVILLDETGKELSSPELAQFIEKRCMDSGKRVVFVVGGAYGATQEMKDRADFTWALSKLVFPHEIVRIILSEQVYRACTIIRNEKYHHA